MHFYTESALRLEVIEPRGIDPRRHGFEGEWAGATRVRLEWRFAKLDGSREEQADISGSGGEPAMDQND